MNLKPADQVAALKLEAIAAMAASLAYDVRNGKLWERERDERVSAIRRELDAIPSEDEKR